MIWFTSDWHFNHRNIAGPTISSWKRGYRNFSSTGEMNDKIINNLNRLVKTDDILYFLGDFAFGNKQQIPQLSERINCATIYLVYGNHDSVIRRNPDYQKLFTDCQDMYHVPNNGNFLVLCHYKLAVFNTSHRGGWHLFGHSHGSLPDDVNTKCFDVGVDTSYPQYGVVKDFEPYSWDDVKKIMDQKKIGLVDHHGPNTN